MYCVAKKVKISNPSKYFLRCKVKKATLLKLAYPLVLKAKSCGIALKQICELFISNLELYNIELPLLELE
jgi:hypothetical protein